MTKTEDCLYAFVRDQLLDGQASDLTVDTPLLKLGILDSVSTQQVFMFVEDQYGVVLDDGKAQPSEFSTIRLMSELIDRRRGVSDAQ